MILTSVLFCRLINKAILLLFLTIFIRYMAKMHDKEHIVDPIPAHVQVYL